MAAAFTPDGSETAERARELRARALELAQVELHAYEPVLEALRLPRDEPERAGRVRAAQDAASEPPLEVARIAAELAELASELARTGNQNLAGDAIAGALLAEASAQAAARLVAINLNEGPVVGEAAELARRAAAARETALS
jgi:methenyltetrahydrofolate cyclohydrolase